jgi:hypothetical protein
LIEGTSPRNESPEVCSIGSVNAIKTDLRSHTRQLIFTVFPAPGDALGRFTQWQAAYALQDIREEARGFGGTTGGNPLDVQRTRGSFDVRHQITFSFATRVASLFSVNTTARVAQDAVYTRRPAHIADGFASDRSSVGRRFRHARRHECATQRRIVARAQLSPKQLTHRGSSSCEGP